MTCSGADKNFARLRERYIDTIVVPASADSELSLRRAEQKGLIKYSPGSEQFEIIKSDELNEKQNNALSFITKDIMGEYMRTGVQFAINIAVFKLLKMNSIYPVANEEKLSDKKGNVLPDLILDERWSNSVWIWQKRFTPIYRKDYFMQKICVII